MIPDDGLPYAYPLSDGGSCSPPSGDDGNCFCCQGAIGGLPDPGFPVNYTGGQVIWKQGIPVPICPL